MKDFAVIGCGGLGARHAQALSKTKESIRVWAVDTSATALEACRDIIEKTPGRNPKSEFQYASGLESLPKKLAFVIIATTNRPRLGILKTLVEKHEVTGMLLEKILFPKWADYDECEKLLKKGLPPTWVNTNMTMVPHYRDLKPFSQGAPVSLNLVGGDIRIASNFIHYIDYIHFLTGATEYEPLIDPRFVTVIDSKRAGFKELEGEAYFRFKDGSSVHISTRNNSDNPFQIEVSTKDAHLFSRDREEKSWLATREGKWAWKESVTPTPFQSRLTTELADQFMAGQKLPLTGLEMSIKLHRPLVQALLKLGNTDEIPFT